MESEQDSEIVALFVAVPEPVPVKGPVLRATDARNDPKDNQSYTAHHYASDKTTLKPSSGAREVSSIV